jgi:hypothetical protein
MAKERSRKNRKAKDKASNPPVSRSAREAPETKTAGKVKPGVRKQLKRLEGQLADAARRERKRLRKLERARYRRQLIEATLDGLRGLTPKDGASKAGAAAGGKTATAAKPDAPTATKPAPAQRATAARATTATKRPSTPAATPAKAAARPRATRPAATGPRAPRAAATPRRTAPKPPPADPAAS